MFIVLLALVIGFSAVLVFFFLPSEHLERVGVEQEILAEAAPPPSVSRFAEWNLVVPAEELC